jgi:hypothetical protein
MPRPRLIIPKRSQQVRIPEDLLARVLADLYSEAEGCVPYSKFSEFVEQCIREHYRRLDEPSRMPANSPPAESGGEPEADLSPASGSMKLGGGDVGCEAHNVQNCPWCKS